MVFLESVELCLHRVAQRVASGGHDVPEADVRRRFGRSPQQFMQRYRLMADDWRLVFNGEAGYVTVAEGACEKLVQVFDETLWMQFVRFSEGGQ